MKYFIAYRNDGKAIVREFETREQMLSFAELLTEAKIKILCVWTEDKNSER